MQERTLLMNKKQKLKYVISGILTLLLEYGWMVRPDDGLYWHRNIRLPFWIILTMVSFIMIIVFLCRLHEATDKKTFFEYYDDFLLIGIALFITGIVNIVIRTIV